MFMRFASPNERRTISREDLGYYNALVIGAVYNIKTDAEITFNSFIEPLKQCITKHPFLSVTVKDKHTEKPYYERVPELDLSKHISIENASHESENENKILERFLLPILDRPWPAELPPWRIIALPLPAKEPHEKRCFIAFSYSHALGDGMSGLIFHKSFLAAWNTVDAYTSTSFIVPPCQENLPSEFDTPQRLPISWKFLLSPLIAAYLPKPILGFLGMHASASPSDAGTWTASRMFFDASDPKSNSSRVKILEIEALLVQDVLKACRAHGTKLTGVMHQIVIRALSTALPDDGAITNLVSGTAVNMCSSIGVPESEWGLYVSGHYAIHPHTETESSLLSEEMWESARRMTTSLAESSSKLHDQPIGLLRYAPSIRGWTESQIGGRRDCSYRISNLLAFDPGESGLSRITKVVFSTPADVTGAPLNLDIVSLKGGSLVCSVGWQAGALGLDDEEGFVERVLEGTRAGFEGVV
ncbi:alcohol acetyltransferase [Aspergillus unguis]